MSKLFLPESLYNVDSTISCKKLSIFYKNNVAVTGHVVRLDAHEQFFEVLLGDGLLGIMPFAEATIYPIYRSNGEFSSALYDLVGKNIQVKVVNIDNNSIMLSRKVHMLEALDVLKHETRIESAEITGFSGLSAFIDIGAGITGRSYGEYFAPTRYLNIKDIGVKKGDFISVEVIEFIEDTMNFELSRVATLPSFSDFLQEGMGIVCKVFEPVNDTEGIGYYVSIPCTVENQIIPGVASGILDSPNQKLEYGTEVACVVTKIKKKGPRLDLIRVIEK